MLPLVQGLLAQFVDYIKDRKTVMLDEVAAEFGLRTQDVINRIQSLESIGRLTGVMDDRGKVGTLRCKGGSCLPPRVFCCRPIQS